MKKLKHLFWMLIAMVTLSCTLSAKSTDTTDEQTQKPTGGEVVALTRADFLSKVFNFEKHPGEWVYEGKKPCIIDFYADWCGPCKRVAPILKELAGTYKKDIIVYKVNVDEEKELAKVFGIQSIPTILFVPAKGTPQVTQGALPKDQIEQLIKEVLLEKKSK